MSKTVLELNTDNLQGHGCEYVPFVCTDVDRKHDGYGVVTDIRLI